MASVRGAPREVRPGDEVPSPVALARARTREEVGEHHWLLGAARVEAHVFRSVVGDATLRRDTGASENEYCTVLREERGEGLNLGFFW
jgi:hypothetical protein